jgi:hypothetical protein
MKNKPQLFYLLAKGLSPEWIAMLKEAGLGKEDILKNPKQMIDVINTYNEGIEVVDDLPSQSQVE